MKKLFWRTPIVCLLFLIPSVHGQGEKKTALRESYDGIQERKLSITKINDRIQTLRESITLTKNEQTAVQGKITNYVRKLDQLESRVGIIEQRLRLSTIDRIRKQNRLNTLNHTLVDKKKNLKKLILILVKFSKFNEAAMLPTDQSKRLSVRDGRAFRQYAQRHASQITELNFLHSEQRALYKTVRGIEKNIQKKKTQALALLEELRFDKKQFLLYLEKITDEHTTNLTRLGSLENKKEALEQQLNRMWKDYLSQKKRLRRMPMAGFSPTKTAPFLLQPLPGKIITVFGSKDKLIKGSQYKGMLIEPTEALPKVFAAYSGTVSYISRLRGFGTVVIVNHGKSDYTVYGMLGEVFAKSGVFLKQGDLLGVAGENTDEKKRFYFEVRMKGNSVDPSGFIFNYTWK